METNQGRIEFTATHWTTLLTLKNGGPQAEQALERLCGRYWYPLYAFLRREGKSSHDAEDLVQTFLSELIRSRRLDSLEPGHGRFRSYLLTGLKNHAVDALRRELREKRRPAGGLVHMDASDAEGRMAADQAADESPDLRYDRAWAETLLNGVMTSLRDEWSENGKGGLFDALCLCLVEDVDAESYRAIGERMGMSEGAVKVAMYRMKESYQERLRAALLETVSSEDEIDEELVYLAALWTR